MLCPHKKILSSTFRISGALVFKDRLKNRLCRSRFSCGCVTLTSFVLWHQDPDPGEDPDQGKDPNPGNKMWCFLQGRQSMKKRMPPAAAATFALNYQSRYSCQSRKKYFIFIMVLQSERTVTILLKGDNLTRFWTQGFFIKLLLLASHLRDRYLPLDDFDDFCSRDMQIRN